MNTGGSAPGVGEIQQKKIQKKKKNNLGGNREKRRMKRFYLKWVSANRIGREGERGFSENPRLT